MGNASPSPPPAASKAASPTAPFAPDGFADLLGTPAAAASGVPADAAPINTADPFGDLLGTPSRGAPAMPTNAARAFPQGTIPDDFDPFAAKPSAETVRNSDDPLRALAEGAVDLGGVTPAAGPSLLDFEPKATRDPLEALGRTPSLVDP